MEEKIQPWLIMRKAMQIYKEKFSTLILYSLFISITDLILDAYPQLFKWMNISSDNLLYLLGQLVLYIPYLYFTFIFSIAIIILCSLYYDNEDMDSKTVIQLSKTKFWKYLLADLEILAYLLLPLLGVFFAVIIFKSYVGIIIAVISFLLMLWLTFRMVLAPYIATLRNEKGSFVKVSMFLTRKQIKSVAIIYFFSSILFRTPFVLIELGELFDVIVGISTQVWFMFLKQCIDLIVRPFTIASLVGLLISLNERLDEEDQLELEDFKEIEVQKKIS